MKTVQHPVFTLGGNRVFALFRSDQTEELELATGWETALFKSATLR